MIQIASIIKHSSTKIKTLKNIVEHLYEQNQLRKKKFYEQLEDFSFRSYIYEENRKNHKRILANKKEELQKYKDDFNEETLKQDNIINELNSKITILNSEKESLSYLLRQKNQMNNTNYDYEKELAHLEELVWSKQVDIKNNDDISITTKDFLNFMKMTDELYDCKTKLNLYPEIMQYDKHIIKGLEENKLANEEKIKNLEKVNELYKLEIEFEKDKYNTLSIELNQNKIINVKFLKLVNELKECKLKLKTIKEEKDKIEQSENQIKNEN